MAYLRARRRSAGRKNPNPVIEANTQQDALPTKVPTPRFLFIHVMKTAGTMFVSHLEKQFGAAAIYPNRQLDRRFPGDTESYTSINDLLALPAERRETIEVYTGHFPYMVRDMLNIELATFTILRDPVERTISQLKQFRRLQERYRPLSLEAIYDDEYVFRHFIHNHQTKIFSLVPADKPRAILRPIVIDENRFQLAKDNLAQVDVVGVTECFDEFIGELQRRFEWWEDGIAVGNRTNVSSESWSVEEALRRRIADDNSYDVDLYEYAKTLALPRTR
jgi:Sulfotransferase family